tara:strand:- start:312 stop:1139 length:828 start_codon:yes stop_codon:yes gene_type:complete
MKKMTFEDCFDVHPGKRIFCFGTGPSVADLSPAQFKHIEEKEISIAANYAPMALKSTYWVGGGHPTLCCFGTDYLHEDTIAFFHHDPGARSMYPDTGRVNFCEDSVYQPWMDHPLPRKPINNTIVGGHNIILSVSHMAYAMGAQEIVYIGFEQVNRLHFYNLWPPEKIEEFKAIIRDLLYKYGPQYPAVAENAPCMLDTEEPDERRWCHFKPVEVCKNLTFKSEGENHHNYPIFKKYVEQFKREGIRVLTTATEGICVHAGAGIVKLEDIIGVGK